MKSIDLVGQKFGHLTAVELIKNPTRHENFFLCECDCGEKVIVSGYSLRKGTTKSCGCLRKQKDHMDLTGQTFGRLTVIGFAGLEKRKGYGNRILWNCLCECGNECTVDTTSLRTGHTTSCGCYKHEREIDANIKHGQHDKQIYKKYYSMLYRCYNPTAERYKSYGQRGISVCDEWLGDNGFQNFYDWAVANGYDENAPKGQCTLDRIDVNRNYCPENCRWISMFEQASNKRNNRVVEYNGESKVLSSWCRELGLKYSKIHNRIYKSGWDAERAFTTP